MDLLDQTKEGTTNILCSRWHITMLTEDMSLARREIMTSWGIDTNSDFSYSLRDTSFVIVVQR